MEEKIFRGFEPDFEAMTDYGFVKTDDCREYHVDFMDGDFTAEIKIFDDGSVAGRVIDNINSEEYAQLGIKSLMGSYVSKVRSCYEDILNDIACKCFRKKLFKSEQANRIAQKIYDTFGDVPDFPWDEKPYKSSGVFRHSDTSKWYALIMSICKAKLVGYEDSLEVDIINLKINEDKGDELRRIKGIYPAYHMNHKQWISIMLEDTINDETIMELVKESHRLTDKKSKGR